MDKQTLWNLFFVHILYHMCVDQHGGGDVAECLEVSSQSTSQEIS
jgi:hypothetical protein